MDFRWLIFLTLWTMLSGPVLARPIIAQESAATAKPAAQPTR
jgi:hypothetical protein